MPSQPVREEEEENKTLKDGQIDERRHSFRSIFDAANSSVSRWGTNDLLAPVALPGVEGLGGKVGLSSEGCGMWWRVCQCV